MARWSENVGLYCVQHEIISEDQLPWFIYGIEKRVVSICTFPPFFLIALFCSTFWSAVALFVSFFLIRRRASGFHANSVGSCLCISLLVEVLFLKIVYPFLRGVQTISITGICLIIIFHLAPYNHPNMNFTEDEISACRSSARINTCILSLATIVAHFAGLHEISKGLLIGIAMATFLLCLAYISEWRKKE